MSAEHICVKTPCGSYLGTMDPDSRVCSFLGLPFAAAPRWRRPQPVRTTGDDVILARSFGKAPWQDEAAWGALLPAGMSEDCLNLNLFLCDPEIPKTAVMVWVYGGAQISGSNVGFRTPEGDAVRFDGGNFVREHPDVLLVVPNYRVGLWGSLDLSFLPDFREEYRWSNNLARLDLAECLRWVRRCAPAFQADPENITLFGQSAGSCNITALLLMPEAAGLFRRVICESSFAADISLTRPEDSITVSKALLRAAGCETLAQALALDNAALLAAQSALGSASAGGSSAFDDIPSKFFAPVADGITIPSDYWQRLLDGGTGGVSFLGGTNAGEYDPQFLPFARRDDPAGARAFLLRQNWSKLEPGRGIAPEAAEAFFRSHPAGDAIPAYMDLKNDLYLRMGALEYAAVCSREAPAYLYYLDLPRPDGSRFGHGAEIPMLFGTDRQTPEAQQRLLREIWSAFALSGNPNTPALAAHWTPFSPKGTDTMVLDSQPRMTGGVRPGHIRLLLPLMREFREVPGFAALWEK